MPEVGQTVTFRTPMQDVLVFDADGRRLKRSEQPPHLEHPLVDYHDVSCKGHVPSDYRAEADDSQTVYNQE
jgi:hypothetical protein